MRRIRHGQSTAGEGWLGGIRGFIGQFRFGAADRPRFIAHVIPNGNYHYPPSYRRERLVVEYATVCFRSQEDFGPGAIV